MKCMSDKANLQGTLLLQCILAAIRRALFPTLCNAPLPLHSTERLFAGWLLQALLWGLSNS